MNATLTADQLQALASAQGGTLHLIDPQTNEVYVLIKETFYDSLLNRSADDGLTMEQVGILIEEAMAEDDAKDPLLETYQNDRRNP